MMILGHHRERERLNRLTEEQRLPQSYLFFGPRGIGKKLVALEFAQKLLGESGVDLEKHPDLLLIRPREETVNSRVKKKQISRDEVRQAALFLSRYPTLSKRRVAIFDEADELTLEAENSLLKTLEEPNETSIIIFVTHHPARLLPTILSRLIPVSFDLLSEEELRAGFPGSKEAPIPDFFYHLGLPALLVRANEDPEGFRSHTDRLRSLFQISRLSLRERLHIAELLAQDEAMLPELLTEWLMGLHAKVTETSNNVEVKKVLLLLDRLEEASSPIINRRGNTRLLLEKMLLPL